MQLLDRIFDDYTKLDRIDTFKKCLIENKIDKDDGDNNIKIDNIFWALDELIKNEISYYYQRRNRSRWGSGLFRTASYLSGLMAISFPLLSPLAASPEAFRIIGSVAAALAVAFVAADRTFGGTAGHARYSTTQLALEQLMTEQRLKWSLFQQTTVATRDQNNIVQAYDLITKYADAAYKTINSETENWRNEVIKSIDNTKNQKQKLQ